MLATEHLVLYAYLKKAEGAPPGRKEAGANRSGSRSTRSKQINQVEATI
jgi:hypothetical protein